MDGVGDELVMTVNGGDQAVITVNGDEVVMIASDRS